MKKIGLLSLVITILLINPACKKSSVSSSSDPTPGEPTPTGIGTAVGSVVSKTIGATGGSISSEDGKAELIFPAGALKDNTDISIQALTNTAPNGIGSGYRFLPNGIKFQQPVTLKFHYTSDDLAATLAELMGIAFQDSIGGWWRLKDLTNDVANKTITASIHHFTVYTPFNLIMIFPTQRSLYIGKSLDMRVDIVESADDQLTDLNSAGEELAPLIKTKSKKITWSANGVTNGNSTFGTLTGNSLETVFKAPSKVPSQNPVAVSAQVDLNFKYLGKTFDKTTLISNIRIVDAEVYLLEIKKLDSVVQLDPDYIVVWDSASMKVTVRDTSVTVSEIVNFAPRATPTQLIFADEGYYYVPDQTGEINITAATGKVGTGVFGNVPNDRLLGLLFTQSGTVDPKYQYKVFSIGYESTSGGAPNPGTPLGWSFELLPDGEIGDGAEPFNGILSSIMEVKLTKQQ